MNDYKFSKIINKLLIPTILHISKLMPGCENMVKELETTVRGSEPELRKEYRERRDSFKENYMMKGLEARINRHKIAAVFYVSFIKVMEKNGFFKSGEEQKYLFAHNVIFNTSIGIIEAFIYFDEGRHDHSQTYRSYVNRFGLISQNIENYHIDMKKYIAWHKEGDMDVLNLAIDFHVIECDSKAEFKEWQKHNKLSALFMAVFNMRKLRHRMEKPLDEAMLQRW